MRAKGILVLTLLAAAAVVPAAAASHKKHARHVRLSLIPLQTAQLGPAGASLPIGFDSGWVSNGLAPPSLKKPERVNGYLLDYGDPHSGGAAVTSIQTQVERFRTPLDAKRAHQFLEEARQARGGALPPGRHCGQRPFLQDSRRRQHGQARASPTPAACRDV